MYFFGEKKKYFFQLDSKNSFELKSKFLNLSESSSTVAELSASPVSMNGVLPLFLSLNPNEKVKISK